VEGGDGEGDYPLFGSTYVGATAPNTLIPGVDEYYQWDAIAYFNISAQVPYKWTQDPEATTCYSPLSGPMAPFLLYDEELSCVTGFSGPNTINRGNGRIIMGTYGSEGLGTRFTFGVGIVVALHN
jgi:hypothetical protein